MQLKEKTSNNSEKQFLTDGNGDNIFGETIEALVKNLNVKFACSKDLFIIWMLSQTL